MKIAVTVLAFSALILASGSCAKHSWEETQVLHEGSHKHGEAHAEDHATPHGAAEAQPSHGETHAAEPAKH